MSGKLHIITGPMFSGKTSELLKRLSTASEIGYNVLYINNILDNRNKKDVFSTHNPLYKEQLKNKKIIFYRAKRIADVPIEIIQNAQMIGIDEAQFFNNLKEDVLELVEKHNKYVIVAGLNSSFKRVQFGGIIDLIPYVDNISFLNASCKNCAHEYDYPQENACFTWRTVDLDPSLDEIDVGGSNKYTALCRKCFLSMQT